MLIYNSSELDRTQGFKPATLKLIQSRVRRLTRRAGFNQSDADDIEQYFTSNLLVAQENFDRTKGSWPAYCETVLANLEKNIYRYRMADCRDYRRERLTSELNASSTDPEFPFYDSSPEVSERVGTSIDLSEAQAALPPKLAPIFTLLEEEHNVAGAAKLLKMPESTVRDGVKKIREIFQRKDLGPFTK